MEYIVIFKVVMKTEDLFSAQNTGEIKNSSETFNSVTKKLHVYILKQWLAFLFSIQEAQNLNLSTYIYQLS